jgi:hypothetical protein
MKKRKPEEGEKFEVTVNGNAPYSAYVDRATKTLQVSGSDLVSVVWTRFFDGEKQKRSFSVRCRNPGADQKEFQIGPASHTCIPVSNEANLGAKQTSATPAPPPPPPLSPPPLTQHNFIRRSPVWNTCSTFPPRAATVPGHHGRQHTRCAIFGCDSCRRNS